MNLLSPFNFINDMSTQYQGAKTIINSTKNNARAANASRQLEDYKERMGEFTARDEAQKALNNKMRQNVASMQF